MQTSYLQEI